MKIKNGAGTGRAISAPSRPIAIPFDDRLLHHLKYEKGLKAPILKSR